MIEQSTRINPWKISTPDLTVVHSWVRKPNRPRKDNWCCMPETVMRFVWAEAKIRPIDLPLLSGRSFKEEITLYGPFVINTHEEIFDAFQDYQQGKNGNDKLIWFGIDQDGSKYLEILFFITKEMSKLKIFLTLILSLSFS